jgi:1-deoxy-D-xylulose-5-phosphate synthase
MSAALGMATARDLMALDYKVVAVVGDGALTCGLSYEGMNNAGHSARDIILIVNDNGMSISPNVGAMNKLLGSIVADPRTNRMREAVKKLTSRCRTVFGPGVVDFAKNVEESVKNSFPAGMFFEEMGFRYFGPIDGHNVDKLSETLAFVRGLTGPRVVHIITEKGKGFAHAEENKEKWHGLAAYDPETGEPRKKASGPPTWTQVFRRRHHRAGEGARRLRRDHGRDALGHRDQHFPEGVAGAVLRHRHRRGTRGHLRGRSRHPGCAADRRHLLDVPAARVRQHHPRRRGAAAARDLRDGPRRTGGEDGQTHMGLYDIAYMLAVPGMTVTAPKDGDELTGLAADRARPSERTRSAPAIPATRRRAILGR